MASSQPPEYHAQDTPLSDNLSPMVGMVCPGTRVPFAAQLGWGEFTLKLVFTTKPSGVTAPSNTIVRPELSKRVRIAVGAFENTGAAVLTR